MRSEHCEAADQKIIKGFYFNYIYFNYIYFINLENIENSGEDRNEIWNSMFGISKGTKITDQDETEIITPYNPGTRPLLLLLCLVLYLTGFLRGNNGRRIFWWFKFTRHSLAL